MDLYEIGSESFSQGYFDYAEDWLNVSLSELLKNNRMYIDSSFKIETILKKFIENKFVQLDFRAIEKYTKKLLSHEKGSTVSFKSRILMNSP